jgi:hypothetical protein
MLECPVCDGARFKRRRLAPGLAVETCTRCGLRISDVASTQPIGYADIDHDAYSRSIGVVRRRQALDIVALAKCHRASGHPLAHRPDDRALARSPERACDLRRQPHRAVEGKLGSSSR